MCVDTQALRLLDPFICWWTFRCFHILATVNKAAMNVGAIVPFWISVFFFFSHIYPGVELLGHMIVLFLFFFEKIPCCFPQWLRYSYHQGARVSFSPHPCQHLLLHKKCSNGDRVTELRKFNHTWTNCVTWILFFN